MEERAGAIVNSYQVRAQGREAKGNLYIVEGGGACAGMGYSALVTINRPTFLHSTS